MYSSCVCVCTLCAMRTMCHLARGCIKYTYVFVLVILCDGGKMEGERSRKRELVEAAIGAGESQSVEMVGSHKNNSFHIMQGLEERLG